MEMSSKQLNIHTESPGGRQRLGMQILELGQIGGRTDLDELPLKECLV